MDNCTYMIENKIDKFSKTFYGYGNLKSDIWFIGKEEGGGNNIDELEKRFKFFNEPKTVVDLKDYHVELEMGKYFCSKKTKNQPTWNKLIRILLSYEGNENTSLDDVKKY